MKTKRAQEGNWLFCDGTFTKEVYAQDSANLDCWTEVDDEFKSRSENGADAELNEENLVLRNTLSSNRDGVGKVIADSSKPFPLYMPQYVDANQFYSLTAEDGTTSKWVAVSDGIVTAENFDSVMERWID